MVYQSDTGPKYLKICLAQVPFTLCRSFYVGALRGFLGQQKWKNRKCIVIVPYTPQALEY